MSVYKTTQEQIRVSFQGTFGDKGAPEREKETSSHPVSLRILNHILRLQSNSNSLIHSLVLRVSIYPHTTNIF